MASTNTPEKPMTEKQRLKHEKFLKKQAAQQAQQEQSSGKQKTLKKQDDASISTTTTVKRSKDWIEETPYGQKKILKPLDSDELHKAYIPKVVESAWYSFWEE